METANQRNDRPVTRRSSLTRLWRVVEAALESPSMLPAQQRRDIVEAVRDLETFQAQHGRMTSTELQIGLEAQAAEGESFRGPDYKSDAERRAYRRRLAELKYAAGTPERRQRAAVIRRRTA
jgi:hypothetical protein